MKKFTSRTIKPHRAIGSETLARWIKIILEGAGIDITLFEPHSTRHAAATAAYAADIPVDEVPKRAGWSFANTFRRFLLQKGY
jgi:integrase